MFGLGMTEILLIAIIAIIVLGPDKLPEAMIKIARMFNSVKKGISDAKTTLDNELNISELKAEANKFKAQIEDTKSSLMADTKIDLGLDDILNDDFEANKKAVLEDKKDIAKDEKTKKEEDSK
ncbi:MAG: Sec-independent protein translocase protein TatB [Aliarcobacter skirrowii]|uniref:Sec-independent protein translocase protein TatB n=1 Tax=Aliarcobacter skirrowii TaxID=28200 RepID=UPI00242B81B9|nr:Sec-independent protein translocase protein TatB [Aliarcobacter skirrowii]MDD2509325.1 Sec-independent protein translocase protein TatB [Aliarcobacter skirrowii]MDD3497646.1 Sec-independent protein translocase protein TatB [Aliarcobacter skirrowii]